MKFDIPIPCFFSGEDFCDAIVKVKALGFDAVETYDWKSLDRPAVKAVCEENGVELVSICTSCFELTDKNMSRAWLEGLEESCKAADEMGVKKLITQSGNDTGEERALQHENIVKTLNMAKPLLETYGVTVMLEPLNIIRDHKGCYLYSSAEAFDIVREVNSSFVKVIYDIYHQQITEGNIIPSVTENLDCIAHLHCAGHPGRNELQYGESDYKNIFRAIDNAGYEGFCGLEYNPTMKPEDSIGEFKRTYLMNNE